MVWLKSTLLTNVIQKDERRVAIKDGERYVNCISIRLGWEEGKEIVNGTKAGPTTLLSDKTKWEKETCERAKEDYFTLSNDRPSPTRNGLKLYLPDSIRI